MKHNIWGGHCTSPSFIPFIMIRIALLFFVLAFSANSYSQKAIFLFERFVAAKVKLKPRGMATYMMNYDAANGKMYFMQGQDMMELMSVTAIDTISWGERKFIPLNKKFAEVSHLKHITVLIDWNIKDILVGKKGAYGMRTEGNVQAFNSFDITGTGNTFGPTIYDHQNAYSNDIHKRRNDNVYYFIIDGKQVKVSKQKHLEKLFPEKAEQIKSYAKENKIDFKDAAQALDLIDYSVGL